MLPLASLLAVVACTAAPPLVRPERSEAENRAARAQCEASAQRRVHSEYAPERARTGAVVPGFPDQNPVASFPARGSLAAEDPFTRAELDRARQQADLRRLQLVRDCLEAAGFRPAVPERG